MRSGDRSKAAVFLALFAGTLWAADDIPDIRDSMEPLELARTGPCVALISVAAILVGIGVFLIARRRARSRSSPVSPETRARQRLAALSGSDARTYYSGLHSILVQFLEHKLAFPASHCTSAEIVRVASSHYEEWAQPIEVFLRACDEAKFASSPLAEWDAADAAWDCRRIIDMIDFAPRISSPSRLSG